MPPGRYHAVESDLQVLSTNRHTGGISAGYHNVVHKTRHRRRAANKESCNGAPVGSKLGRVAVDAMEVVHVRHGNVAPPDNEVVAHENRCHGPQKDGVASDESKERRSGFEDLPGDKRPATDKGCEQLAAADVDVLGGEGHEIVGSTDGVCGDVDAEGDDDQADGAECSGSTSAAGARLHPQADDLDGVPDDFTVCCLSGSGGEDAEQANDG